MSLYTAPLTTTKGEEAKTTPKRLLQTFQEVQAWQRDNEYLRNHYRSTTGSYRECLKSLSYLHNQTGNIYTHLIGAVVILSYGIYAYNSVSARYVTADINDLLAFGVFIGSAVACFGISATFHMFGNHSSAVYHTWLQLDLYGIFILIVGTVYSGTYYGFYCERQYWMLYSVGITTIVTGAATLCSIPRFRTPKWRWARATLFCAIGWSGAVPMTHAAQSFGIEQADKQMGWWLMICEGLCYITGAFIYAVRFPERFRPGLFDIWGCSHQIFHLCAVGGAAWHLVALLKAFDYNHDPATRRC
ncbi:hypothetical protein AA0111_g8468 [Alternaria arborescens]|uniref:hypothetical protein n=1 Tax=Alternaria arborescens TaxID=156630 RepID=UPI0010755CA9|nr:hypothetical protein AA0111_g8468 [Alternaria arborescens]RYO25913.1 hypothetical protein AA0111_g8468 [Alternaria arborescens]